MNKQTEHLVAVINEVLADEAFKTDRDKNAFSRAFRVVAENYSVNESTVRDKCTRRLGFTTDEFVTAVIGFANGTSDALLRKIPSEAVTGLNNGLQSRAKVPVGDIHEKVPGKNRNACVRCTAVLPAGAIFCPNCGEKVGGGAQRPVVQPTRTDTLTGGHKCHNTLKGQAVVMDGVIYFLSRDCIYSVPLTGKHKAQLVFDPLSFFPKHPEHPTYRGTISRIDCWNGKLFFHCCHDVPDANGDCAYGLFSFDPFAKKLDLVIRDGSDFVVDSGKAYCINQNLFVTIDLTTGKISKIDMPMVAPKDWPGPKADWDEQDGRIIEQWSPPLIHNGYVYTSRKLGAQVSLRFPVNDPNLYQFLPYNSCVYAGDKLRCHALIFASRGDILILVHNLYELRALSIETLNPIEGLNEKDAHLASYMDNWEQYANILVFESISGKVVAYSIDKLKPLGKVDPRYASMIRVIVGGGFVYAIGDLRLENDEGDEIYDGLALYKIPTDKIFKNNTNLDDYAQPLF